MSILRMLFRFRPPPDPKEIRACHELSPIAKADKVLVSSWSQLRCLKRASKPKLFSTAERFDMLTAHVAQTGLGRARLTL